MLIAGENWKVALFKNISSEFSPVFRLLEDVLLDDCLQISRGSDKPVGETCSHAKNKLHRSNFLWKLLRKRLMRWRWVLKLFRLAYNRLFHVSTLWMGRHRQMPWHFVDKLNAKGRNFFFGKYTTQTWTKQALQTAYNVVMIQIQELRSPKTSRARDVELSLRSLFGEKFDSTPLNKSE